MKYKRRMTNSICRGKANRRLTTMACLVGVLFSSSAFATVVPQMETVELLENSALVVIGTVSAVDETTVNPVTGAPKTDVTFSDLEVIDGDYTEDTLTFSMPYGHDAEGNYFEIVGSPIFVDGEQYILFVRDGDWSLTPITNWWHSVFRKKTIGMSDYWVDQNGDLIFGLDSKGFKKSGKVAKSEKKKKSEADGSDAVVWEEEVPTETTMGDVKTTDEIILDLEWFIDVKKEKDKAKAKKAKKIKKKSKRLDTLEMEVASVTGEEVE